MSGLETAAAVYGLITGTITIIEVSIQIYDAVKDKSGIPPKLRKVSEKLPSLVEILKDADNQRKANEPADEKWIEAGNDVKRCHDACQDLQDLLQQAYPKTDANKLVRSCKAINTVIKHKGKTAEQLLAEISGCLDLLTKRHILKNTKLLENIKNTVDDLMSQPGHSQSNVNGDNIIGDKINGSKFVGGAGQMLNFPGGTYHAPGVPDELNEDLCIRRLQDWLSFAEIDYRESEIKEAHKATFRWALETRVTPDGVTDPDPRLATWLRDFDGLENVTDPNPDLAAWLRDCDGLFWIQGKLGSGKSTLMKYVWQNPLLETHLRTWADGKPLHRASFFFSKKGASELQRSLQGLYRTLIAHLIRSEVGLARIAFPHWRLRDGDCEPDCGVLRSAFLRILEHASLSQKYFFAIDGLDEYEESNSRLQTELARDILNLVNLPGVKIVVASRPEAPFVGRFHECPTLRLQDITRSDIEAYVTVELRQKTAARPLSEIQIEDLADLVIDKAEGVFLWVVLVVTDLVVGIDHAESYLELRERLSQLNHDLRTLFKQILLERISPSHRQQIARHLLMASYCKKCRTRTGFTYAVVHAIGHQVQVKAASTQPDVYDVSNTWQRTVDLRTQLSIRSRGIFSTPDDPELASHASVNLIFSTPGDPELVSYASVTLIHSSMFEFLAHPDIHTILEKQAGDFEPGLAVTIGLIARLVMHLHEIRIELEIMDPLSGVMRFIEIDRLVSGVVRLQSTACLEHLLEKSLPGYPRPNLRSITWWWTFRAMDSRRPRLKIRAGLLEYATYRGFTCYVQRQIEFSHGITHLDGCPLLFYAVTYKSLKGLSGPDRVYDKTLQRVGMCELLLQHGADPNEIYRCQTPWGMLIYLSMTIWRPWRPYRSDPQWKHERDVLCAGLDAARHMLHHGADPDFHKAVSGTNRSPDRNGEGSEFDKDSDCVSTHFFGDLLNKDCCKPKSVANCSCTRARRVQQDSDCVSTRFFGDLLNKDCCKLKSVANCSCARARLVRPKLVELVELVKQKKLEKQLGPRVHLGWPGQPESKLFSIPYYLWVGPTALLVIALFKAWEWFSERYGAESRESRATVASRDSAQKSRADRRRAANAKLAELDEFKQRYRLGQYF